MKRRPSHLVAKFAGAGATEEVWRQFKLLAEKRKRANKNKLLIDFMGAYADASLADRYFIGDKAEIFVPYYLINVAAVNKPEQLGPQKFCEMAALNRWVNACIFTSAQDAEDWLLLQPAAPKKRAAGQHHAKSSHRAYYTHHTHH